MREKETVGILMVEDSSTQAEKLKHILESGSINISVDWVPDAKKALEYLNRQHPAIVITDVLMPGMDGFELCTEIKHNPELSLIPVVLLTALSDPQDIIRGLECGADNFITKPYQKDQLLSQIEYMLANARLRKMAHKRSSEVPDMGMEIYFGGKKHYIMSSQLQILDLLFSSFDIYIRKNKELDEMNKQLIARNDRIKSLQGLVPICANCKKIRDDDGYWQQVDEYLEDHSEADFNLSICPQCEAGD